MGGHIGHERTGYGIWGQSSQPGRVNIIFGTVPYQVPYMKKLNNFLWFQHNNMYPFILKKQ